MENKNDAPRGGIQVIERAARILKTLKGHPAGMSLGQIAQSVDLPRSTVQRIVGALAAEDLITVGTRRGRIRLGPEIADMAARTRINVVEACRLVLTELSLASGETTDLSILQGDQMLFLDQVPGVHRLRTVSAVGDAFPLTSTANGQACLALLPEKVALAKATAEWERLGQSRDKKDFAKTLAEVRETGLAFAIDTYSVGISAIGVAFSDHYDNLYSISVPIPSSRFPKVRDTVEPLVLKAKAHAIKVLD